MNIAVASSSMTSTIETPIDASQIAWNKILTACYPTKNRFSDKDSTKRAAENSKVYNFAIESPKIRLISILPGTLPEQIQLQMSKGDWPESKYEALSYAWGSFILRDKILIDGSPFWVTQSLYQALRHLRKEKGTRTMWIDAICINQFDVKERNDQVRIMREIYLSAQNVVVWLGIPPGGMNQLFQYFASMPAADFHHVHIQTSEPSSRCPELDRIYFQIGNPEEAAAAISKASWWDRMWVVQEFVMAKSVTVQYGDCFMEWPRLCALLDIFLSSQRPNSHREAFHSHHILDKLRTQRQDNISGRLHLEYGLLSLAYEFRSKLCEDPRDRLYALLGLLLESQTSVRADYSLQPVAVYREFCRVCINEYKSLLPLGIAEELPHSSSSWLPDWTTSKRGHTPLLWLDSLPRSNEPYSPWPHYWDSEFSAAAGHFAVNCTVEDNDEVIRVRGFLHDTIQFVSSEWKKPRRNRGDWAGHWKICLRNWSEVASQAKNAAYADPEIAFRCTVTGGRHTPESGPEVELRSALPEADEALAWFCTGRCFFVTKRGFFGKSNPKIRKGDICVVALGSDVPIVLRKNSVWCLDEDWKIKWDVPSSSKRMPLYRFVGQAYVHGIMKYDGNLFDDDRAGKIRLQEFYLK